MLEPQAASTRTTCVGKGLRVDQGLQRVIGHCMGTDLVTVQVCFGWMAKNLQRSLRMHMVEGLLSSY